MACRLKKIIQLNEATSYVDIRILNGSSDITTLCQYSWSTDSVCWTNWASIDMYKRICPNLDTDFYLRVLVDNPFDNVMLGNTYTKCYSVCLDSSMNFLSNFCEDPNLFQPYKNLDCAL